MDKETPLEAPKWLDKFEHQLRRGVFNQLKILSDKYKPMFVLSPNTPFIMVSIPSLKRPGGVITVQVDLTEYPFVEREYQVVIPKYSILHKGHSEKSVNALVGEIGSLLEALRNAELDKKFMEGNKEYHTDDWVIFWYRPTKNEALKCCICSNTKERLYYDETNPHMIFCGSSCQRKFYFQ